MVEIILFMKNQQSKLSFLVQTLLANAHFSLLIDFQARIGFVSNDTAFDALRKFNVSCLSSGSTNWIMNTCIWHMDMSNVYFPGKGTE